MIAVQVFVGLVLFAAFLGLLTILARWLESIRREQIGRGLREATGRQWAAVVAVSLAGVAAAGALGWALA